MTIASKYPIVLSFSWMQAHNPHISWAKKQIISWSQKCLDKCLHVATVLTAFISIENPDSPSKVEFPPEYHEYITNVSRSSSLEPRLSETTSTHYQAMSEYIDEALVQGNIRPSTSPASAGLFFVEKKGGHLRPYIDY